MEHTDQMLTEIERLYHSALLAPQPTSVPAALQSVAGRTAHRFIQEGEALSRRGMSTGATALLDLAVERYMGGLSEQTPAFQASLIVGAIADTLRKRFEFSRDPNDLKDAVTLLELISSNIDPAKFLDRDLVNVTAVGLVASYYAGGGEPDHLEGELDHLDMAVELGQALLIHGAGDPAPWRYLNTTAGAYSARYVRDGRIADLDRAFRILERAIAIVPKDNPDRLAVLFNSGEAGLELNRISGTDDGIRLSRKVANEALSMPNLDEYVRPRLQILYAESLLARLADERPIEAETARLAVEAARSALSSATKSGLEIERIRVTFGNALVSLFHATNTFRYLREAIDQYRIAISE